MQVGRYRMRLVPAILSTGTIFLASAGAATCYYNWSISCCTWASPGPDVLRMCGQTYCGDEIIDDPDTTLRLTASGAGHNPSSQDPTCTCVYKAKHCSGGFCVSDIGNTSTPVTGSQVDLQSACSTGGPG